MPAPLDFSGEMPGSNSCHLVIVTKRAYRRRRDVHSCVGTFIRCLGSVASELPYERGSLFRLCIADVKHGGAFVYNKTSTDCAANMRAMVNSQLRRGWTTCTHAVLTYNRVSMRYFLELTRYPSRRKVKRDLGYEDEVRSFFRV